MIDLKSLSIGELAFELVRLEECLEAKRYEDPNEYQRIRSKIYFIKNELENRRRGR